MPIHVPIHEPIRAPTRSGSTVATHAREAAVEEECGVLLREQPHGGMHELAVVVV